MLKRSAGLLIDWHGHFIASMIACSGAKTSEEVRRATLTIKILSYGTLVCLLMTVIRFRGGGGLDVWVSGFGAFSFFSLLTILFLFGRYSAVADLSIALVLALIMLMAFSDGGLLSRVLTWLPALPLMASFIGVRVRAMSACILGVMGLLGLLAAHSFGLIENRMPGEPLVGRMIAGIAAMFFVSAIAQAYESARQDAELSIIAATTRAEQLAQLKSDFLANMSHEIRSPLNAMLGMLRLLKRSELDQLQAERTQLAYSNAQSLLALLNDILDLSKMDAGKIQLEHVVFDLNCMLGELGEALSVAAEEKGLELILDFTSVSHSMIKSDSTRIKQIFTNLITNAIKFTEQGEIVVCISIEPCDGSCVSGLAGSRGIDRDSFFILRGEVKDSGIGISSVNQASLFEVFTQADSSITRTHGGSGLGLAICKKICNAMQGDINVTSSEGQGSRFYFDVVVARAADVPSQDAFLAPNLTGLKILIVDDNQRSADVLAKQLSLWGADVDTELGATSGLSVFRAHLKTPFAIILIDFEMPDIDGVTMVRLFREQFPDSQCKLFLMTLKSSALNMQKLPALGVDAQISKPITLAGLQRVFNV